jgi:hypothetical protein
MERPVQCHHPDQRHGLPEPAAAQSEDDRGSPPDWLHTFELLGKKGEVSRDWSLCAGPHQCQVDGPRLRSYASCRFSSFMLQSVS